MDFGGVVVFWSPFFNSPRRPGRSWVRGIRLEPGVPKPFQLTSGVPMHLRTVPKRDDGRGCGLRDDVTHSVMTSQDDVGRMGMLHFRKAPFKTVTGHIRILDGMRTDPSYGTHTSQIGAPPPASGQAAFLGTQFLRACLRVRVGDVGSSSWARCKMDE